MAFDAVLRPRGPLPPGVYWRRRLVLLLVVVFVFVLIAWSCSGNDPAKVSSSPSPTGSVRPTPTKKPTPKPTVTASRPATTAPTSAPPTSPPPVRACADSDIQVEATADAKSYPAGALPQLTLAVTNTSVTACRRDIGAKAAELRVLSGGDQVWSSDDCNPSSVSKVVTLNPGVRTVVSHLRWSRKRSKPNCPPGQPAAAPGTYRAVGRLDTAVQVGDSFSLA